VTKLVDRRALLRLTAGKTIVPSHDYRVEHASPRIADKLLVDRTIQGVGFAAWV